SDPDGDTFLVTYTWVNTTRSLALAAEDAVVLSPPLARPRDVLTCTASWTDGAGTGQASATLTVANRAPVASTPTLSPELPYIDGDLTCMGTATDPDGTVPSLYYRYTNLTQERTYSGLTRTLSHEDAPHDVYQCVGLASDGITQ